MHEHEPYELVQPPRQVTQGLLLARWRDQAMVLVAGRVEWVAADELVIDWAPWGTAVASNA
jgi:hypothetical protein